MVCCRSYLYGEVFVIALGFPLPLPLDQLKYRLWIPTGLLLVLELIPKAFEAKTFLFVVALICLGRHSDFLVVQESCWYPPEPSLLLDCAF